MRRGLRTSRTTLKTFQHLNHRGARGEEEEQEIENLFEKIMKENFPNMVKEIDYHEVQEAQRAPNKFDQKRNMPRHIIIKLPKIKDKERILETSRE